MPNPVRLIHQERTRTASQQEPEINLNLAQNSRTNKDFNKTSCCAKVSGNPGNYMQTCVEFARLARGTAGRLTREVIFPNRFPKILR